MSNGLLQKLYIARNVTSGFTASVIRSLIPGDLGDRAFQRLLLYDTKVCAGYAHRLMDFKLKTIKFKHYFRNERGVRVVCFLKKLLK